MSEPPYNLYFSCIDDEIEGIEKYAKMAIFYKESNPDIADIFYKISLQEDEHYRQLLEIAKKLTESEELDDMGKKLYDYILDCKTKCHESAVSCQHKYKR